MGYVCLSGFGPVLPVRLISVAFLAVRFTAFFAAATFLATFLAAFFTDLFAAFLADFFATFRIVIEFL